MKYQKMISHDCAELSIKILRLNSIFQVKKSSEWKALSSMMTPCTVQSWSTFALSLWYDQDGDFENNAVLNEM